MTPRSRDADFGRGLPSRNSADADPHDAGKGFGDTGSPSALAAGIAVSRRVIDLRELPHQPSSYPVASRNSLGTIVFEPHRRKELLIDAAAWLILEVERIMIVESVPKAEDGSHE